MKKVSVGIYFYMGTQHSYLRGCREGTPLHEEDFIFDNLKRYLDNVNQVDLIVSKNTYSYNELVKLREQLKSSSDRLISAETAKKISKLIISLEETVAAEMSQRELFQTTPKVFEMKKLLETPHELFDLHVWAKVDEITKYDLVNACRCLALELPTATAFHLMRATESVLRQFYLKKIQRKRVKPLLWGLMGNHLEKKLNQDKYGHTVSQLKIIKDFRNETQHPDKIYDMSEAQNLFFICIECINRLTKEI